MRIGIISDTHGMLRQEVKDALAGCDAIFHAGDVCEAYILEELEQIAPVYAARGNNDWSLAHILSWKVSIELEGKKILITHIEGYINEDISEYDMVVYGHTHRYTEKMKGDTLFINPGTCGPCPPGRPITLAIADLSAEGIRIERVEIPNPWTWE